MPLEVATPDKLEYVFYPATSGIFRFKVRAPNDAHIALASGPNDSGSLIEIFLGGWSNSKSVIRKDKTQPERAQEQTPNILSAGEYRGFWIRWTPDGIYTVGREGEAAAFLSYHDPEPVQISYAGICTGWGASGSWLIEENIVPSAPYGQNYAPPPSCGQGGLCFVPSGNGQLPEGAFVAGQDGEPLYVARSSHENNLIPGKFVQSHGVAYIPFGGSEHAHNDYDILVGQGTWVPVSGGNIPGQAFPAGETSDGEPLFIGRAHHEGTVTPGKVQPSHGTCYIPYGGMELAYNEYEVLVA